LFFEAWFLKNRAVFSHYSKRESSFFSYGNKNIRVLLSKTPLKQNVCTMLT
jgi:hypothetical protein